MKTTEAILALRNHLIFGKFPNSGIIDAIHMAIEALNRQRWIPVTERMPEDFENVLIWDKIDNDPFTGHYSKSDGWTIDGWENAPDSTFKITHWMPCPEPPKEGGTEK